MDVAPSATTLLAGFKGSWIVGYANRLIAADPQAGNEGVLKLNTGGGLDSRELDSPITNMARMAAGWPSRPDRASGCSAGSVGDWQMAGRAGAVLPAELSDSEDYIFLTSAASFTPARRVMEWNPNAGASKQGWRAAGLEGRTCYGGTVAGNMLVVSIQNRAGEFELWAFDGTGWWLMRSVTTAARVCLPVGRREHGPARIPQRGRGRRLRSLPHGLPRPRQIMPMRRPAASRPPCWMLASATPTKLAGQSARSSRRPPCVAIRPRSMA